MADFSLQAQQIMNERFAKDSLISLATAVDGVPYVRTVNALYEEGSFYIITYALSSKMKQIETNPIVAISGDWFTAHGLGENLGWFGKPQNKAMADKLTSAFASWIDNGHNNFEDENTIILRIKLTHGVLFANGIRHEIDFG